MSKRFFKQGDFHYPQLIVSQVYNLEETKGVRMMKKRIILVFFVALCFTFLPNLQAFAENPKTGGTLRIGARVPQFNRIDVRYPTTGSMVPAFDLIHEPLFGWEKEGLHL